MKFALQALFQTFFLEVSRGSFLCERAARFEVDYTQRTACHHEKCCSRKVLVALAWYWWQRRRKPCQRIRASVAW